jgi:hypothetical protein
VTIKDKITMKNMPRHLGLIVIEGRRRSTHSIFGKWEKGEPICGTRL